MLFARIDTAIHEVSAHNGCSHTCIVALRYRSSLSRHTGFTLGDCMNRRVPIFALTVLSLTLIGLITVSSTAAYGQAISGNLVGTVMESFFAVVSNGHFTESIRPHFLFLCFWSLHWKFSPLKHSHFKARRKKNP